jgi:hypothetical protein
MIKLEKAPFRHIVEEVAKGNAYQLLTRKGDINDKLVFTIIKRIVNKKIFYADYSIQEGMKKQDAGTSPLSAWNWHGFDFYMLDKNEAAPYLKEVMLNDLEKHNVTT